MYSGLFTGLSSAFESSPSGKTAKSLMFNPFGYYHCAYCSQELPTMGITYLAIHVDVLPSDCAAFGICAVLESQTNRSSGWIGFCGTGIGYISGSTRGRIDVMGGASQTVERAKQGDKV